MLPDKISLPINVAKDLMSPEQVRLMTEMLNSQSMRLFQEHIASTAAEYAADAANLLVNSDPGDEERAYDVRERVLAATMLTRANDFIDGCRAEDYSFSTTKLEPKPQAVVTSPAER